MPAEIVVAGHICLDVIPRMETATDLTPGTLVHVGPATMSTGGAVANTGLGLRRLGANVRLIGKVGDDGFGRIIAESLGNDDRLIVDPAVSSSYTVVINRPGFDRTFLHCPGANDAFSPSEVDDTDLLGAKILHFGYPPLMRSVFEDGGSGLADLFRRAKGGGLLTSLDMSLPDPESAAGKVDWRKFLSRVLPWVDFFCPSMDELAFMLPDLDGVESGARRCVELGARVVMLKLGGAGIFVSASSESPIFDWRGSSLLQPVVPTQVVGTTGSGDATIAGFLFAIARGFDLPRAAKTAVAVGSCCCEAADAVSGIPDWPTLSARFGLKS